MRRTLLSLLVVGLFAGVGTSAMAQNVTAETQPNADADSNTQQTADPAAGGATAAERDQAYEAALKNCEPLIGTDKTKCVEAAKKKSGQM